MQRWKLTIEYDGTDFCGWQVQDEQMSVQQAIEEAVEQFTKVKTRIHGAGRTDSGVHATGQVAHVDINSKYDAKEVRDAINYYLRPHKVSIVSAEAVSQDFEARFQGKHRVYCYRITLHPSSDITLDQGHVWHLNGDLNISAMQEAANHLIGEHDFTSFRAKACQAKSPVRTMHRLEITEVENKLISGRHLEVWAEAPSFLHHQIRNIVGTLKMVGEGKFSPDDIPKMLAAKHRREAGVKAPAHGLYFVRVDY